MSDNQELSPSEYSARRSAQRRLDRRVLVPALLLSAALHFAVLRISIEPDSDRLPPAATRLIDAERVMRAYDITAVTTEVPPIDVQVLDREVRRELIAPDAPWQVVPRSDAPPPADDSAPVRDRLRYRMGSAEVWRPHTDPHGDIMSAEEVVRARIAAELKVFNDSLIAEQGARARALDWTVTDANGDRWGIGEGGVIHLGKITVPMQIQFQPPPGRRDEFNARRRSWTETQLHVSRVENEELIRERIRLIRERMERERGAPQQTGGSGGG
jgi:hypothetical protein